VFLKTLNALYDCLQYKHPSSIKRFIRSDKPITLLFPVKSQKCDFGAEPRSRIIATSAVKWLKLFAALHVSFRGRSTSFQDARFTMCAAVGIK
jgi:hypothetical protein